MNVIGKLEETFVTVLDAEDISFPLDILSSIFTFVLQCFFSPISFSLSLSLSLSLFLPLDFVTGLGLLLPRNVATNGNEKLCCVDPVPVYGKVCLKHE